MVVVPLKSAIPPPTSPAVFFWNFDLVIENVPIEPSATAPPSSAAELPLNMLAMISTVEVVRRYIAPPSSLDVVFLLNLDLLITTTPSPAASIPRHS